MPVEPGGAAVRVMNARDRCGAAQGGGRNDGANPVGAGHAPRVRPRADRPGAVKLASNELAFPTLPAVAQAIADAAVHESAGINRYPDNGATALINALAAHIGPPESHLVAGCGSVALCQQLVQATAGTGDEVLFGWRSFEAYPIVTQIAGARRCGCR